MDTTIDQSPGDLDEFLDRNWQADGFNPVPQYFPDGDYLTYFFKEDLCYAERIDELLTVYVSDDNGEMVGCKIKGVSQLFEHVSHIIGVSDGKVELKWFFLTAVSCSPSKKRYYELGEKAKGVTIDTREIRVRSLAESGSPAPSASPSAPAQAV